MSNNMFCLEIQSKCWRKILLSVLSLIKDKNLLNEQTRIFFLFCFFLAVLGLSCNMRDL